MATMRAEAVDMIYGLSDNQVEKVMKFLKNIARVDEKSDDERRRERDAAYKRLTAWIEENKDVWGEDFDWKEEYGKALDEKYGLAN